MLKGNRARGLIVIGGSCQADDLVAELARQRAPLVLLDSYLYPMPIDSIQMEHMVGGYLATRHLVELGHHDIGFIKEPEKFKTLRDRADGYFRALRDAGLAANPS